MLISVCIYPTPLLQAGCDTRSVIKQSKAILNSEFFLLDLSSNEG